MQSTAARAIHILQEPLQGWPFRAAVSGRSFSRTIRKKAAVAYFPRVG